MSATDEQIRARLPPISELTATRREYVVPLPPPLSTFVAKSLLADERDLPMVHLMFNISITSIPLAVLCYKYPSHWLCAFALLFTFFMWAQRFILCLHFSEHRRLFKKEFGVFNLWSTVLSPLFGLPPGVYHLHHVVMHHLENNVFPYDISSTMPYQRDRFTHFLHYWGKYLVYTFIYLPYYAFIRQRYKLFAQFWICTAVYTYVLYMLSQYSVIATAWLFGGAFLLASFALMFGNYSQHIFVDPDNPTSTHGLAYNCINHIENLYTFNDGLHHLHHLNSRTHWTELPATLIRLAPKFAHEDVFVFDGMHFFQVGVAVFTQNWDELYDHFVDLKCDKKRPREEMIALFKKRMRPCGDIQYKF